METPALKCEKCGQPSAYAAVKCGKCGLVFEAGAVKNDFPDKCPKCKYSKIEDERKKAISGNTQ